MLLELRVWPDRVLRRRAEPIRDLNEELVRLAHDMAETMYARGGIGLAAPQVGALWRLVTVDVGEGLLYLVNPELLEQEGEQRGEEGCLSIPGVRLQIARSERLQLRAWDLQGRELRLEAEGLLARVLQHEVDHLNGVLILDRASPLERSLVRRRLRR